MNNYNHLPKVFVKGYNSDGKGGPLKDSILMGLSN